LAVLPLFAALVVYGSVKNHSNERGEMSNEIGCESRFSRVDRVERVDGGELDFSRKGRKECVDGEVEENVADPQIGTNLRKSICGDVCGFVDCNARENLHVSIRSTRLNNSVSSVVENISAAVQSIFARALPAYWDTAAVGAAASMAKSLMKPSVRYDIIPTYEV
jgi:hypothetical protein